MRSFLVRLWIPAEPEADDDRDVLRRLVEEIGAGTPRPFTSGKELVRYLTAAKQRTAGGLLRSRERR